MESVTINSSLKKRNSLFIILSFLLFIGIAVINISFHEMWRDELQALMIAGESYSFSELFTNTNFEYSPLLWHACLYLLRNLPNPILVLKILNLIIVATTIYVFLKFSPFTKLQKLLFSLGYFPLYEYGTISRNHSLNILFIFLFCVFFKPKQKNYLLISLILFLLCQVNLLSLVIAAILIATLLFDYLLSKKLYSERGLTFIKKIEICISSIIILSAFLTSFISARTIKMTVHILKQAVNFKSIANASIIIWRSYVPIPKINYNFWNSNIIDSNTAQIILSILLFSLVIIFLHRKPIACFLYTLGTSLLVFSLGKIYYYSSDTFHFIRYEGYAYILLVICFWIESYYYTTNLSIGYPGGLTKICNKSRNIFLTTILAIHFTIGMVASLTEWFHPFSASKDVANFIKKNNMGNLLMAGDWDFSVSAISFYLNKKIYYPRSDTFGSYIIWNNERKIKNNRDDIDFYTKIREFKKTKKEDILLLMTYELDDSKIPIKKIKEFTQSIVDDERYYLYLY
ncbi:MAG: hypothetical protein KBB01_04135 [Candidatus Omnitrophica bacterium]|jgi:hypothetical protein|nr:hypothetical protein [Candidatus Omnitrophota bacterium]